MGSVLVDSSGAEGVPIPMKPSIRASLCPIPRDVVAELVVVLTQFAETGVDRGLELFSEFVGAALLVPDDSQADHQQGDELSDGVCLHAP